MDWDEYDEIEDEDYEDEWPEIAEENERFLESFRSALRLLPDGEVEAHIARVRLFLFDFFHENGESDITDASEDIPYFFDYLIDNHICRTTASIKKMTESIWKFYRFMFECGEITDFDYVDVCDSLIGRDALIEACREANPDIEDEDINAEGEYDDDFFAKCIRMLSAERLDGMQE